MADDDEIDVIGDFSINSCLPVSDSCMTRRQGLLESDLGPEQPQWLLDSVSTSCWFDSPQAGKRHNYQNTNDGILGVPPTHTSEIITEQMSVTVDRSPPFDFSNDIESIECQGNVPNFVHEEVLVDCELPVSMHGAMSMVNTGQPTVSRVTVYRPSDSVRDVFGKKTNAVAKSKHSLLKPNVLEDIKTKLNSNISDMSKEVLLYADDFVIGSTEYVGGSDDSVDKDVADTNMVRSHLMIKTEKKAGNHRRKYTSSTSSSGSKGLAKSKFNIAVSMKNKYRSKRTKSPAKIRSKGEIIETTGSPKLQLVFSSGQALPVSEGEQVIKIDKNKSAESESDVDIDIDSDENNGAVKPAGLKTEHRRENDKIETKTTLAQRKFEPVRRRQKKVKLDGDGGCTIMHTASGDLIEVLPEPRKEKVHKKQPINLLACKHFTNDKPAPYSVRLLVSALVLMDAHAHGSRAEVMGLLGGELRAGVLHLRGYQPCAAAASHTHCDMCPVSQARAAEALNVAGHAVVGWHHSHPRFAAQPSELDLRTQRSLQQALERQHAPFLALITSQHWPRGRVASTYRCFRVESEGAESGDEGYQFSVKLLPDLTAQGVPDFLERLRDVAGSHAAADAAYRVNMAADVCADAGVTYLEKCLSSVSHHLTSAGYSEQDLTFKHVMRGVRDVFR